MNNFKNEELIYVNDNKKGINCCGYNVNSILFNSGVSPILTLNNKNNKSKITSIFDNLVVPNWTLHYEPNKSKTEIINEDNSTFEIIDDNLFDKLIDLAEYKEPFLSEFPKNKEEIIKPKKTKHKKTKSKDLIKKIRKNKKTRKA